MHATGVDPRVEDADLDPIAGITLAACAQAAGAFASAVALFRLGLTMRSGITPITPDTLRSSATRSGVATTKMAFITMEADPAT